MSKRILLALGLSLWSTFAWAQNPQCPTRPTGDSTNACASTAFVQNATANPPLAHTHIFVGNSSGLATDFGTLATFSDNGTLTITPSTGSAQGLVVAQPGLIGTIAGTVSSCTAGNPTFAYNQICIANDGAIVTGATDPKFTFANSVAMITGGASTGTKGALNIFLQKFSASSPSVARDHIALNINALIDGGDGGTGTTLNTAKGTMFAGGFDVTARSGATNLLGLVNMELGRALLTGSSAYYSAVLNLVDKGNKRADGLDAAIIIGGGGGGSGGFGNIILISDLNGGLPLNSTSTVIGTSTSTLMTIGSAIDFGTNVAIINYLLRGPGGYIDGNFNIVGASANLGGVGLSSGVITAKGTIDGIATFNTQAHQSNPNYTLPTGSGTLVTSVTAPIVIDSVTGRISCGTCVTSGGGGTGVALTKTDDTNVTLTLGGSPSTALVNAASITVGWTGTLAAARLNANVVQAVTNDTNITGSISAQNLTFAWAGTLANSRLATMATNTVKGNATSGTASPTDLAVASCSTASSALIWTTNTGFGCNTSITATSMPTTGLTGTLQAAQEPAHTGDVTNSAGSLALTLTTAQPAVHTWALAQTFTVAPVFTDQSGSRTALGLGTMATQNASAVAITGGTIAGLTGLAIRDTSAAFDVTIAATSSATLTAGRTLTINMGNVAHTLALGTTAGIITFPNTAADTVAMLAIPNTFTAQQTITVAGSTQLILKSTGANNSYITIDTSQVTLQSGFQLNDNGTAKWQFIRQTDDSFLIFDNANGIVAQSITPGATTVGFVSFGYTTDATSTSTGAIRNPGGMSINKRVFMNGITTSSGLQTAVLCQSSAGEVIADSVACLASSREFKEGFKKLTDAAALNNVTRFSPQSWHYRREGNVFPERYYRERIGLVAEDVAEVDKRLVEYDNDGRVRTIDYNGIVTLAVGAISALEARLESLENRR